MRARRGLAPVARAIPRQGPRQGEMPEVLVRARDARFAASAACHVPGVRQDGRDTAPTATRSPPSLAGLGGAPLAAGGVGVLGAAADRSTRLAVARAGSGVVRALSDRNAARRLAAAGSHAAWRIKLARRRSAEDARRGRPCRIDLQVHSRERPRASSVKEVESDLRRTAAIGAVVRCSTPGESCQARVAWAAVRRIGRRDGRGGEPAL